MNRFCWCLILTIAMIGAVRPEDRQLLIGDTASSTAFTAFIDSTGCELARISAVVINTETQKTEREIAVDWDCVAKWAKKNRSVQNLEMVAATALILQAVKDGTAKDITPTK